MTDFKKDNEIQQYRPAFFDGFEIETVAFDTLEELVKIPFVANFTTSKNFYRFSAIGNTLMAEYRDGQEWWVCGFLKKPVVGLPNKLTSNFCACGCDDMVRQIVSRLREDHRRDVYEADGPRNRTIGTGEYFISHQGGGPISPDVIKGMVAQGLLRRKWPDCECYVLANHVIAATPR